MTRTTALAPVLAEHIAAVNAFDEDAIVATFAGDALVNDVHREFWGTEAIRGWVARELVGDRVTIEVTEVLDHHGDTIVRGRYDGNYDKTNLPDVFNGQTTGHPCTATEITVMTGNAATALPPGLVDSIGK
jgi:hypothetical protein